MTILSKSLSFTNGTLIDEGFCREILKVKNYISAISPKRFDCGSAILG